ncbi:cardiac-enriched FHL2-interacting protein [Mustelus asterias]
MNSLDNRCAEKPRIMQGRPKHVDGFSDTSSAGSILDEADREVSRLTERAFKSLCVAEEGMCNDLDIPGSPSAVNVNRASDLPGPDGGKRPAGELKNCNESSRLTQGQPKPDTFQESAARRSLEEGDAKGSAGNGFPRGTVGSSQKASKQKSKVSSLIVAFDQSDSDLTGDLALSAKQAASGLSELAEEYNIENIAQWDTSAIVNMHKEKSSFSAACQEHYWANKKQLPPGKGSKANMFSHMKSAQYWKQGHATDSTVLRHSGKKSIDSLPEKVNKLKTPDSRSNFLHSECSAFKSWHDHSKFLSEEDGHIGKLDVDPAPSARMQSLCDDVTSCRKAHSLTQRQPPNEIKADATQKAANSSPGGKDSDFRSSVPEESHSSAKESAEQGNSEQLVRPEKNNSGAVENGDEGKGFQLWRTSRTPQYKKQIDSEVVSGEIIATECHLAVNPKEAPTLAEQPPPGESPSFSISKLLTPNIVPNANGADMSTHQPMVVTPPLTQLPAAQRDDIKGGTDYQQSRESYKSKASSLLYNLKDVRKRVKSTYSCTSTPQNLSEQSKSKECVFQNIHQANERTSSAPLRLGVQENVMGDSSEQEKPDKMPNAINSAATAGGLGKAAIIHKAEPDPWKNDDYLNLRSPQTVKEAGTYPAWRTRNARPRSAIISTEIHAERGLDRKVVYQLDKLHERREADCPSAPLQGKSTLARNSPEEAKAVPVKAEEKQNRPHRSRKPECPSFSHTHKANYPNDSHFRMKDDRLALQRAEETCRPMLEGHVSSNGTSSHPVKEDKATSQLPNHSYFVLGDGRYQDTERAMADHSTERTMGGNARRSSSSGCPTAEVLKDGERHELQYYALSDPAANAEGKGENQNLQREFQGHLPEKTPRDLPAGHRVKGNSPLDMMCEEKFYSIFSKQEIRGPGNNMTSSPRLARFKLKDNVLKTTPVTKSTKSTVPKSTPESADVDSLKVTPTMFTSEENLECDKLDSEEMLAGRSAAMNPRPDSTCSVDSKAASKPPVVPPKSEKALRRAKKLATRRKRTDSKQRKQDGEDSETETSVSNMPMSPPCIPVPQTPTVCSPVPTLPMDSCVIPAVPNIMALNSTRPVTSLHSFPLSQRKLLQDPESGQYFFVDIPIQVQTKTLYDPETDKYFQVSIPSTGQNASLDFFNNSYVLYPGYLSFPLTSVSAIRPSSHMSAPAILLDVQGKETPLNEWTNTDSRCTGEQGNQPYIETFFEPHTGCRAGIEGETQDGQSQPEGHNLELIVMGDLEDIAIENN